MAKVIVVRQDRCLGCKSCEIECALAHCQAATLVEALTAEQKPQSRVHVEPSGQFGVPLQCCHCEDAPCVTACPTEAIRRHTPDGPVLIDADRCIGCKFCLLVCPFGVIELAHDGRAMVKCDQCFEHTQAGEQPACVAACPTGALQFVELDEFLRQRRRELARRVTGVRLADDDDE